MTSAQNESQALGDLAVVEVVQFLGFFRRTEELLVRAKGLRVARESSGDALPEVNDVLHVLVEERVQQNLFGLLADAVMEAARAQR